MNTTQRLMQEAKSALGIESDYALAKALEMSRQAISHYRTGRSQLDVEGAFRIAEVLGKDPAAIIAAVEAERATKPEAREAWIQRLKQLGGVAASVVFVMSGALPAPADAAGAAHDNGACHRQQLTVFRSARTYAARCLAAMSRSIRGIFQQCCGPAVAAPAIA